MLIPGASREFHLYPSKGITQVASKGAAKAAVLMDGENEAQVKMKIRFRASRRVTKSHSLVGALVFMVLIAMQWSLPAMAVSDSVETAALMAFKKAQPDPGRQLSDWVGNDPCGNSSWNGIYCSTDSSNVSHVVEIRAMNFNLGGTLVPDIGNLSSLLRLNVMNNNLTGQIPPALGKLGNLKLFLVNNNRLTGSIPPELGNLINMTRFQIDLNNFTGALPPELGNLTSVKHLHMNNNSLSGPLPEDLGRLSTLNHLIVDHNQITGPLPASLANIPELTIIQLDNNPVGGTFPQNWTRIPSLLKLSMRNCSLSGGVPDVGAMPNLTFIDMSYNNLTGGLPVNNFSHMITLGFSNNRLEGNLPPIYAALDDIQNLDVSNNLNLNGSIPRFGTGKSFNNESAVVIVDLQNNNFTGWDAVTLDAATRRNKKIWLTGNPAMCGSNGLVPGGAQLSVCGETSSVLQQDATSGSPAPVPGAGSCPASCKDQTAVLVAADNATCWCATPITVKIRLKSPSFTYFDQGYLSYFQGLCAQSLGISTYQVRVSSTARLPELYAQDITLLVFPPAKNTSFNSTGFEEIFLLFASWRVSAGTEWSLSVAGPYDFIAFLTDSGKKSEKRLSAGAVVGIVLGSAALASALVALVTFLLLRRRSKYSQSKFGGGRHNLPAGINIKGVKGFTFAELSKATDGFNTDHELGQGGYGKVYKGVLGDGVIVAIKRAQEGSMQGTAQFYTEIELLSRVHHRNLVQLLGYCNDRGEQMLIYEFMPGGTLRDHLIPTEILDFARRLHIALGTARGILYLHTEADPPIFHRDIKASNILLDERYNAKVADFGLSKLAPIPDLSGATPEHVSTIVKGTPGYLDPEYFLTQKLTDKTDVYSLGVVLLELITGMLPISYGKNIVREVTRAMQEGDIMSIADPQMGPSPPLHGLEPMLKLALSCCENESEARPRMVDIVRELEDIWRQTKPPGLSKVDSDTFSIDMDRLQPGKASAAGAGDSAARYSALEPSSSAGSYSFQDVSHSGTYPNNKPGDFRSSMVNPR